MRFRWVLLHIWITVVMSVAAQDVTVTSWAYQLQNVDIDEIAASNYDLIVLDYSADGTSDGAYSATEIELLHEAGKVVLAYMSIGEAEDYRFYWDATWDDNPPDWLDEENPDWQGNYKVRYWDTDWQTLIIDNYLRAIMDAGFDGVYLDIIDAYQYYEEQGRESAGQEMVDWVQAIATSAKAQNPNFMIFPQNGAQLALDYPEYLDFVDGMGQEDIYYGYEADNEATPHDIVIELEMALDAFVEAGKIVLVVAYTDDPDQIADHIARSQARGYIPFATYRDLDRLP
jgi:cysteinyl-tRNA synthetase